MYAAAFTASVSLLAAAGAAGSGALCRFFVDDGSTSAGRLLAPVALLIVLGAAPAACAGAVVMITGGLAGAFILDLSITGAASVVSRIESADLVAAATSLSLCFGGVSPVFIVMVVSASVTPATLVGVHLYFLSLRLFFDDASSESG